MTYSNKIVLACAGSGKTWGICKDAISRESSKKKLLISYTNKSIEALKNEYRKQNNGIIDSNIVICTWYQFLLREIIKPYQSAVLDNKVNYIKSINFENQYGISYQKKGTHYYFLDGRRNLKVNNVSELALSVNSISGGKSINRLEKTFSHIYIDELQDLVGRDIELIELLFSSNLHTYLVGDYKQSTLKTHNPKSNKKKTGMYVFDYLKSVQNNYGLKIVNSNESRRFTQAIADIANLIYPGNPIIGLNVDKVDHSGVFIIEKKDIHKYIKEIKPTVLRFDKRTDTYGYFASNFGLSKGLTFERVLIFPNGPLRQFLKNPDKDMGSKEKYFVGVTRPKYTLTFVVDKLEENVYFQKDELSISESKIPCLKYK